MYEGLKQFVRNTSSLFFIARMLRKVRVMVLFPIYVKRTRSYLSSHEIRKLQIGTGENPFSGWLNTDVVIRARGVVPLDAKKRFTFSDRSFQYIFTEHQIEQLSYLEAQAMLKECCRILTPGGKIRIATPSLETLIGLCAANKTDVQQRYIEWIIDRFIPGITDYKGTIVINNAINGFGHRFLYDYDTLKGSLEAAGFIDVALCQLEESEDESFKGIESHGKAVGNMEMARFETMVLEAMRPLD